MANLLAKIFGTSHDREMKRLQPFVQKINALEPQMEKLTDSELQNQTQIFKDRLAKGETLDDILIEAFATLREAAKRVLGMRHYDVQLIGGMTLHRGAVAEMRTGEGKTLVATLPVYLNALSGKGVHVVTVNDYLATRDSEWMGQLYKWMGLSVGIIVHNLSDQQRKESYNCDIVYGTNNEFGFDYLRDNMKFSAERFVQRELNYAIVDECDSILIDEARTPLIISGPSEDSVDKYYEINKIIPKLQLDVHFTMEEKSKQVSLTEDGNAKVEELLGVDNIYDIQNIWMMHHIYQGLKAHHLFKRDVDYMIVDDEIVIVDEFTGRLMPGRRWSDGLHQAVEAKEGVTVKSENQTLATITFQNFFRMYNKLSGMTGTAETEAMEFKKIYNLDVVVIPTNKPIARKDLNDVIYKNEAAKYRAIVEDIKSRAAKGQPILVGTVSIEKSERLSSMLQKYNVKHSVLNAKHHEHEAEIVAQAGRLAAVTIATNMAGRGTDIVLGGNSEFMARRINADETTEEYKEALRRFKAQCEEEKKKVLEAGGLYIIGTERHEARRVDNQLRGRAGRQGDPGESKFYLSLDDDLLRIFNGDTMKRIMERFNFPEDEPIEARMVNRSIEGAQKKVEGHNFEIRKSLIEFDDVMNQQRTIIYGLRREVLQGENIERSVLDVMGDVTSDILDRYAPEDAKLSDWDLESMASALNRIGVNYTAADLQNIPAQDITNTVSAAVKEVFDSQKTRLASIFDQVVRMVYLEAIDTLWKDHLKNIDKIREGIHLRAYGQKDPVAEYKKEAFKAFESVLAEIKNTTVERVLRVQVLTPEEVEASRREFEDENLDYSGSEDGVSAFDSTQSQQLMGMTQNHQNLQMNRGPSAQDLNRKQRRQSEKKKKKKLKL
ncbi:MAG: preprotein translocase subunit SecA [Bdellovibrionaceae bacterium]|nr:preprotein translocase subunit SecA [Pseudobdellovibrionaceae bacterium]